MFSQNRWDSVWYHYISVDLICFVMIRETWWTYEVIILLENMIELVFE